MAQRKLPKRLFKDKEVIHTYQHDRESKTSMKHMTRDHLDVLQNIEAMLIAYAREEPSVDDRVIDEALELSRRDEGDIEDTQVHVKGYATSWTIYAQPEPMSPIRFGRGRCEPSRTRCDGIPA